MSAFHPNRGQWHPGVSWMAHVPEELHSQYHGAGWCRVKLHGLEPVAIQYLEDFPGGDGTRQIDVERAHFPLMGEIIAMASCYTLCIDAGSVSGAILAALSELVGPEDDEEEEEEE